MSASSAAAVIASLAAAGSLSPSLLASSWVADELLELVRRHHGRGLALGQLAGQIGTRADLRGRGRFAHRVERLVALRGHLARADGHAGGLGCLLDHRRDDHLQQDRVLCIAGVARRHGLEIARGLVLQLVDADRLPVHDGGRADLVGTAGRQRRHGEQTSGGHGEPASDVPAVGSRVARAVHRLPCPYVVSVASGRADGAPSSRTASTSSRHQDSMSRSRNGWPPTLAVEGLGTRMLRTAGLTREPG